MRFLHSMIRVKNLESALNFFCRDLGLVETRRTDYPQGKFSLIFLATPDDVLEAEKNSTHPAEIELTHNWEHDADYGGGRNFGHLAYAVDDIYASCERLLQADVTISRPPRDGRMAFVRSPDDISVELLQKGTALEPKEPWLSMPNIGEW